MASVLQKSGIFHGFRRQSAGSVDEARAQYLLGVTTLLVGVFCFTGANSLLTTWLIIQAGNFSFPAAAIGLLTSLYFCGFIAGCLFGGKLVARVGHIRSFAGFAALATIVTLLHSVVADAVFWIALRFISGFSHAMLQMTAESWLNAVSSNETRSRTFSIYRIVDLTSVTIAQFGIMLGDQNGGYLVFALIAVSICLSLLPLTLSGSTGPAQITNAKIDVRKLFAMAPMAAAAALGFGFVSGGFWGLAPVFLGTFDYGTDTVAIFLGIAIVGGALSQWPIGRLSDRIDRRLVMMFCAATAIAAAMLLTFGAEMRPFLLAGAFLFGASFMPLYALAVSHANDSADAQSFVSVAGALLLCFGVGAVLGPVVFSTAMGLFGGGTLFIGIALVLLCLIAFGVWRRYAKATLSEDEKDEFVFLAQASQATPEALHLDPRAEEYTESGEATANETNDEPIPASA
ncbi:MAG: MFS transporter [Rhizobiales bacterium]|nr:MFS transporter [Hyphomicrobiales bacterium]